MGVESMTKASAKWRLGRLLPVMLLGLALRPEAAMAQANGFSICNCPGLAATINARTASFSAAIADSAKAIAAGIGKISTSVDLANADLMLLVQNHAAQTSASINASAAAPSQMVDAKINSDKMVAVAKETIKAQREFPKIDANACQTLSGFTTVGPASLIAASNYRTMATQLDNFVLGKPGTSCEGGNLSCTAKAYERYTQNFCDAQRFPSLCKGGIKPEMVNADVKAATILNIGTIRTPEQQGAITSYIVNALGGNHRVGFSQGELNRVDGKMRFQENRSLSSRLSLAYDGLNYMRSLRVAGVSGGAWAKDLLGDYGKDLPADLSFYDLLRILSSERFKFPQHYMNQHKDKSSVERELAMYEGVHMMQRWIRFQLMLRILAVRSAYLSTLLDEEQRQLDKYMGNI